MTADQLADVKAPCWIEVRDPRWRESRTYLLLEHPIIVGTQVSALTCYNPVLRWYEHAVPHEHAVRVIGPLEVPEP